LPVSTSRIRTILEMIKFEHSVFALPFALTGALLAARYAAGGGTVAGLSAVAGFHAKAGWPSWRQILWIIVAMVGARSAAMTMNRIIDLRYDRENPRTRARDRSAFSRVRLGLRCGGFRGAGDRSVAIEHSCL
jgi:4-hydroxybenzoate polyprenyltransferase